MTISAGLTERARGLAQRLRAFAGRGAAHSADYSLIAEGEVPTAEGWKERSTAAQQHEAFQRLVDEARAGNPRLDFEIAAKAIEATGLADPLVIEVGCGSGYYSEVLSSLLHRRLRYVGLDFSPAMVNLAHETYQDFPFLAADACRLPLRGAACDILLNGTSLMHIADYRRAISESVRASRAWCIFHTVPVIAKRETTLLHKQAYGQRVVEIIFNQQELEAMLKQNGLAIEQVFESIPYDVSAVVGEPSWTLTYLCRKV